MPEATAVAQPPAGKILFKNGEHPEFLKEVVRRNDSKRDFLAHTASEEDFNLFLHEDRKPRLVLGHGDTALDLTINSRCHEQMGEKAGIPKKYYDRMLTEAPELLRGNLQWWWRNNPQTVMIRTLDGTARACLSDSYRCIDNYDILNACLPAFRETGLTIKESAVTDDRMYMKAIFPGVEREIVRDNGHTRQHRVVSAGIIMSNSEVGQGRYKLEAMIWDQVCSNGLIVGVSLAKTHLGRRQGLDDGNFAELEKFLADDTKAALDAALLLQTRDAVRAMANPDLFAKHCEQLQRMADTPLPTNVTIPKLVEVTGKRLSLNQTETDNIMRFLIDGGDMSQWGLLSAVTRAAQESDYDRRIDIERDAFTLVELPPTEWERFTSMN